MLELVAVGPEPGQRWRRPIPENQAIHLGRSPDHGWSVPWDLRISRDHAELQLVDGQLMIHCFDGALNPAYFEGEEIRQFSLPVGETFRIGATTFRFERGAETLAATEPAQAEYHFDREQIDGFRFQHPERCLEVLANLSKIGTCCHSDDDFAQHLVSLLLDGIQQANTAAVMQSNDSPTDDDSSNNSKPKVLRLDSREVDSYRSKPSRSLVTAAMQCGETMLRVWTETKHANGDVDWAFCMPMPQTSFPGWSLYVSGRLNSATSTVDDLHGDLRLAQLLSDLTSTIRHQPKQSNTLQTPDDTISPAA